jgi:hypothetical protein
MNTQERGAIQKMMRDAERKAQHGGVMPKDYYDGFIAALEWVLVRA